MAVFTTPHLASDGFLIGGRPTSTITKLINTIAGWNDTRVTRKALSKLSDRELDDIGLNRGDIDNIAG